jgi:hypothetical protein
MSHSAAGADERATQKTNTDGCRMPGQDRTATRLQGWVNDASGEKTIRLSQKCSPNCDFYSRSTFSVITQPNGWVQCEG